jgi:hypothetical protein
MFIANEIQPDTNGLTKNSQPEVIEAQTMPPMFDDAVVDLL